MIYVLFLLSYLLGAIPTAYIFVKIVKKSDIRKQGSGNVGATNAFRILGWKYGLLIFFLDMSKGFIPAFFGTKILGINDPNKIWALSFGVVAMIGHIFPIYLKFKGGKGVATGAGVFAAVMPITTIIALAVWGIVLVIFRYVSLASIIASISIPTITAIQYFNGDLSKKYLFYFTLMVSLGIIIMHKSNIKRLINKEERKIF